VCAVETGDLERAQRELAEVAGGLEQVRFDLNWLPAMALTAVAASRLGELDVARRLRPLLAPYRHQFVDNASTFFGSVEHFYALCSALVDDHDAADTSFEAATVAHRRLGSPPLLARTQLEHADALARRAPPDTGRAIELATAALVEAEPSGYRTVVDRGTELLTRLEASVR
jgi:hypothetical protein